MKNVLQTRQKERTRWAALHSKCSQSVVELPVAMTTSERSENEKAEKIVKFRQRGRLPTEAVRGSFLNFLPQLTPWMSHIDILSLTVWAGWPAVRARLFCHRLENYLVHRKHVHSCSPFGPSAASSRCPLFRKWDGQIRLFCQVTVETIPDLFIFLLDLWVDRQSGMLWSLLNGL